jgi:hypothetical protein
MLVPQIQNVPSQHPRSGPSPARPPVPNNVVVSPTISRRLSLGSPTMSRRMSGVIIEEKDICYRLLLGGELVGRLIGRGGASIKQIREISGANVAVLEKETPPQLLAMNERIVRISGTADMKDRAVRLILHRIKEYTLKETTGIRNDEWIDETSPDPFARLNDDVPALLCLLVPDSACSHIIGTRGETLKRIADESKATIQVPRDPIPGYPGQRRIQLSGSISEVRGETTLVSSVVLRCVTPLCSFIVL